MKNNYPYMSVRKRSPSKLMFLISGSLAAKKVMPES
jgi:hypothetical protein